MTEEVKKVTVSVLTEKQGKFMTSLSIEEAKAAVEEAEATGELLQLPYLNAAGVVGDGVNRYNAIVDTVRHLDLTKVEIVGYEMMTHKPVESDEEDED